MKLLSAQRVVVSLSLWKFSLRILLPLEIARFSPLLRVLSSSILSLSLLSSDARIDFRFTIAVVNVQRIKSFGSRVQNVRYRLSLSLSLSLMSEALSLTVERYIRQNNFRISLFPRKIISLPLSLSLFLFLKYTLWKFGILSTKLLPKMVNDVYWRWHSLSC